MKIPLTFFFLTVLLITVCASPEDVSDPEIIQEVKEMILSEVYEPLADNTPTQKSYAQSPSIEGVAGSDEIKKEAVKGSSFKEDTLVFLMDQGYSQAEALDILNLATVSAVGHMIAYENKSKQELGEYLLERGYSRQEVEAVMGEANTQLIKEALRRGLPMEDITKGFAERGFTTEEIQTIQRMIVVEQVKKALSEGMSPEEITSALEERGFTQEEIDEIMEDAGYQPKRSLRVILFVFVFLLIVLMVNVILLWKKKTAKRISADDSNMDLELIKLLDEKNRVEEMIELAKTKYHRRALDEESFREIIRDHQKKLIEIEAKIKHLESRVQRLEDKSPK
ncbi:MAG: hypothetical protein JW778_03930 [Candidatus Altiarchaeota archaeon]|nr:hypothetical protein [Candidatus Altiarchaeota archaeon]